MFWGYWLDARCTEIDKRDSLTWIRYNTEHTYVYIITNPMRDQYTMYVYAYMMSVQKSYEK